MCSVGGCSLYSKLGCWLCSPSLHSELNLAVSSSGEGESEGESEREIVREREPMVAQKAVVFIWFQQHLSLLSKNKKLNLFGGPYLSIACHVLIKYTGTHSYPIVV